MYLLALVFLIKLSFRNVCTSFALIFACYYHHSLTFSNFRGEHLHGYCHALTLLLLLYPATAANSATVSRMVVVVCYGANRKPVLSLRLLYSFYSFCTTNSYRATTVNTHNIQTRCVGNTHTHTHTSLLSCSLILGVCCSSCSPPNSSFVKYHHIPSFSFCRSVLLLCLLVTLHLFISTYKLNCVSIAFNHRRRRKERSRMRTPRE